MYPEKGSLQVGTDADIMVFAVTNAPPSQQNVGPEMWKRHKLAQKITEAKDTPIDLSVEEVAIVKAAIAAVYHTAIAGPAWEVLENA